MVYNPDEVEKDINEEEFKGDRGDREIFNKIMKDMGFGFCSCCGNEDLEYIKHIDEKEQKESHHIHPRFMDNPKGLGQQFLINKKKHFILHGYIMKWIWKEIPKDKKSQVVENIIYKSKKFIEGENENKIH